MTRRVRASTCKKIYTIVPSPRHTTAARAMSIPLSLLVQLAHDLSEGRKRRREWEEGAAQGRRCEACGAAEPPGDGTPDAAEMRLMQEALCARGLSPRAPDAEHAFLGLVSASARGAATLPAGCAAEVEWMCGSDEPHGRRQAWSGRHHGPRQRVATAEEALGRLSTILNASTSLTTSCDDPEETDDDAAWLAEMADEELLQAEVEERALEERSASPTEQSASPTPSPTTARKGGMRAEASPRPGSMPWPSSEGSPIPSTNVESAKLSPVLSPKRPKWSSCDVGIITAIGWAKPQD